MEKTLKKLENVLKVAQDSKIHYTIKETSNNRILIIFAKGWYITEINLSRKEFNSSGLKLSSIE